MDNSVAPRPHTDAVNERGPLFQVLAVGCVLVILALVLAPTSQAALTPVMTVHRTLESWGAPVWLASVGVWGALFNVLLFVPVGVLGVLTLPRSRVRTWALVALAASVSVEATQALLLEDRVPSLVDVAANTLGGYLGALATRGVSGSRP